MQSMMLWDLDVREPQHVIEFVHGRKICLGHRLTGASDLKAIHRVK
jgi:hypothetical protein